MSITQSICIPCKKIKSAGSYEGTERGVVGARVCPCVLQEAIARETSTVTFIDLYSYINLTLGLPGVQYVHLPGIVFLFLTSFSALSKTQTEKRK